MDSIVWRPLPLLDFTKNIFGLSHLCSNVRQSWSQVVFHRSLVPSAPSSKGPSLCVILLKYLLVCCILGGEMCISVCHTMIINKDVRQSWSQVVFHRFLVPSCYPPLEPGTTWCTHRTIWNHACGVWPMFVHLWAACQFEWNSLEFARGQYRTKNSPGLILRRCQRVSHGYQTVLDIHDCHLNFTCWRDVVK